MPTIGDIVPRASIENDVPTEIRLSSATELIPHSGQDGREYFSIVVEFKTPEMESAKVREVTISRNCVDEIKSVGEEAGVIGMPTWYSILRTGQGFHTAYAVKVIPNE